MDTYHLQFNVQDSVFLLADTATAESSYEL